MSDHTPRLVERHCDVAVIGGSAAGLGAALQLGRQRRSVIVIDSGEPRNAPAAHMHGYLGHEGLPPGDLTALAREEVRSYGGEVLPGRALDVTRHGDRFRVELTGGHSVSARRVLAATGIVDELPEVKGLTDHWGTGVIHCPFCHGYEVRDQRVVQLLTHPAALHPSTLWCQLTDDFTIVLHENVSTDHPALDRLRAGGVRVIDQQARSIVSSDDGQVAAVELADGSRIPADAIAIAPRFTPRIEAFRSVGLAAQQHVTGLGTYVEVDPTGATSIPGLYAAGNVTDPSQQVLQAAAHGTRVGAMISFSLADEDLDTLDRRSANQADWDRRYSSDRLWSGNPNGALIAEVSGLEPGTALDVGSGEGADAIWLAEQGWTVTANDISQRALDRVSAEASERGVQVETIRADVNQTQPFGSDRYDLVCAHYASIPRTADDRGIRHLLDAVAPGGTLLFVTHDLEPMRAPVDTNEHTRMFDPDSYVRVDDIVAAIESSPSWLIEVNEQRTRPPGHTHASHHVDDLVLRARRLPHTS